MTDQAAQQPAITEQAAAERLAALRSRSTTRTKPAHTSKILSAGICTTALLGLVAAMGRPTGAGSAQSGAVGATQAVLPPTPAPTATTVAPLVPTVPPATAPLVIPAAIPVSAATTLPVATASNTVTKMSGTKTSG